MPEDKAFQTLQSSPEMIKVDITLLTIQARDLAGALFQRLSRNDGDVVIVYNAFVNIFYQIYLGIKYNAEEIGKIENWDKKVVVLDNLFYERILNKHELIPQVMLMYFDAFLGDLIRAGIYNLSVGEFYDKGVI